MVLSTLCPAVYTFLLVIPNVAKRNKDSGDIAGNEIISKSDALITVM
jgi:hypothetical protein